MTQSRVAIRELGRLSRLFADERGGAFLIEPVHAVMVARPSRPPPASTPLGMIGFTARGKSNRTRRQPATPTPALEEVPGRSREASDGLAGF
jgi:hypothetical protein